MGKFAVSVAVIVLAVLTVGERSGAELVSQGAPKGWTRVVASGPSDPSPWVLYERVKKHQLCQAFVSPNVEPSTSGGGQCSPVPSLRPHGDAIVGGDSYVDGVYEGERYLVGKLASPLGRLRVEDKVGRRYDVRMSGRSFVVAIGNRHPRRVLAEWPSGKDHVVCPIIWDRAVNDAIIVCPAYA